ncbi:MAG TPA: PEP-utilizing enzyme [Dehalococcoidia bacterium]
MSGERIQVGDKIVDLATWVPELDTPVYEEFPVYTSANAGEVIPGVVPPLSMDVSGQVIDHGFVWMAEQLGALRGIKLDRQRHLRYLGFFYGRSHLNLSLIRAGADLLFGTSAEQVDEQYLGQARDPDAPRRRYSLRQRWLRLSSLPRGLRAQRAHAGRVRRNEETVREYLARERAADLSRLSPAELLGKLRENIQLQRRAAELHLMSSALASTGMAQLESAVRRWLPEADGSTVPNLCTGLAEVESAKPSFEIWRLSRMVRDSQALSAVFREQPADRIAEALAAFQAKDVREFRRALDAFLEEYGYRGMREVDLATPSWEENPSFVLAMIRNYLDEDDEHDPRRVQERQAQRRQETERWALSRLKPWQKPLFRSFLKGAREFSAARELTKSQWVRLLNQCRKITREIGRRLAADGILAAPEDVHFLWLDEVYTLGSGRDLGYDVRERVQARRAELEAFERIEIPEWFEGRPPARLQDAASEAPEAAGQRVLTGIPVSPGRVTARARVITDVRRDAHIEEGEVLVAPVTDAAWTPLFLSAAAVVVDLGGPLSHGSTVAREYGLPAVVNVKVGTKVIKTGQEITVDGTKGEVIIHGG